MTFFNTLPLISSITASLLIAVSIIAIVVAIYYRRTKQKGTNSKISLLEVRKAAGIASEADDVYLATHNVIKIWTLPTVHLMLFAYITKTSKAIMNTKLPDIINTFNPFYNRKLTELSVKLTKDNKRLTTEYHDIQQQRNKTVIALRESEKKWKALEAKLLLNGTADVKQESESFSTEQSSVISSKFA